MKIAITGATGMLGKACIEHFINNGHEVLALARGNLVETSHPKLFTSSVTDYSKSSLKSILRGVDAIIHLAAMRPNSQADAIGYRPYFEANVQSTENLLFAASENCIPSISLASSISVYSTRNSIPYREGDYAYPLNYYGASKLACEHLLFLHSAKLGIRWTSLRIAQIIGVDNTSRYKMFMHFMDLARRKEPLTLWGTGAGARDAIYIKDVVAAFECCMAPRGASGVYNIGGGKAFTHRELAEAINAAYDNVGNLVYLSAKPDDPSCFFMDCSLAQSELGWKRRWTIQAAFEDLRLSHET